MEKFIVLDVEGLSTCRPYNIGYIVGDKSGKIHEKHSYALPETLWENFCGTMNLEAVTPMMCKNIQEILADYGKEKRKYQYISIVDFQKEFENTIKRNKIKRLFAYNVSFDKSSLKRLFGEEIFSKIDLQYCDILSTILYTKLLRKKYVNYCIHNGYITEKKNVQTKAEIVYRYLTKKHDFIEEHTGLADVLIEFEILLTAFKTKKKMVTSPCCGWRELKNFCTINNIVLN